MGIRGFIFDFDGLIIDTETPHFQAWEEVYDGYGVRFPAELLMAEIGTSEGKFDPVEYLQAFVSHPLDRENIILFKRQRTMDLVKARPILPGVMNYLAYAKLNDLHIGLASSSSRTWVENHLRSRNLLDRFECVFTADDVKYTKPDPELFSLAISRLNIFPNEALILEDSPHGVTAAKKAGANCIAVATDYSRLMDLSSADIIINSLAELEPADAIQIFNRPITN